MWNENAAACPEAPATSRIQARDAGAGVGLGVTLIIVGALALGVRFVPGVSWLAMWPLIFVVGGFVQMVTPAGAQGWTAHRFAEGVGTALFGVALLGCTTGYVGWGMWLTLLSLWPLLLVVIGLRMVGHASGQTWLAAAATLIVWGALLFSAAGSWSGTWELRPVPPGIDFSLVSEPEASAELFADTVVDTVSGPLSLETY